MHVVAAPDKFRGTATAREVAAAIAEAAARVGATCTQVPMADGGEGTLDAFGGANRQTSVSGPLGAPVLAGWRYDEGTCRAVIESAAACGLELAGGAAGNDPEAATTRGVGQLIAAALTEGARRILVGVGGSATTDGGAGAVEALRAAGYVEALRTVDVQVCCDVTTPFTDAARVFAPQKGADAAAVERLTLRLERLRLQYEAEYGVDLDALPGSGAAGGLAGGLSLLGARLVGGADLVADEVGLDAALAGADLVITGEGRLDESSLAGKVVAAVARRARAAGVPVVVVAGDVVSGVRPEGAEVVSLLVEVGRDRAFGDTTAAVAEVVSTLLTEGRGTGT